MDENEAFVTECLRNAPAGFTGDEPPEAAIVRYIRYLEARCSRAHVQQTIGVVEAGSRIVGMVIE